MKQTALDSVRFQMRERLHRLLLEPRRMNQLGLLDLVAEWALFGVLLFFAIGTIAYLMGMIEVQRRGKLAAVVMLTLLGITAVLGLLLG